MIDEWLACPIQENVVRGKSAFFTLIFLNTPLNEKPSTARWTEPGSKKSFVILDCIFSYPHLFVLGHPRQPYA